jgi:hypothetical protein
MQAGNLFLNALEFDNVNGWNFEQVSLPFILDDRIDFFGKNPIGRGCSIEFNLFGQMPWSVSWRLGVQRKLLKKELASGVRRAAVIARTGWNEKASCN